MLFPRGILSVAALLTWLHAAHLTVSSGGWLTPFQGCQKSQAWWWLPYTSRSFWAPSSNPGTFPIFSFLLRDSCVEGTHRTCDIYYESFPFFIVHHCNVRLVCLHCQIQLLLLCSHPVFLLSMEQWTVLSLSLSSSSSSSLLSLFFYALSCASCNAESNQWTYCTKGRCQFVDRTCRSC